MNSLRLPGASLSFTEKRACRTKVRACCASEAAGHCPGITHCLSSCKIGRGVLLWGHGLCCIDTTEEFQWDLPSSAHSCFDTKAHCHLVGGQETSELLLLLGSYSSGNFGPPSLRTEGQRYHVPISTAQEISVVRHLGKQKREGRRASMPEGS